jgi:hypothetical protein
MKTTVGEALLLAQAHAERFVKELSGENTHVSYDGVRLSCDRIKSIIDALQSNSGCGGMLYCEETKRFEVELK